ncbi:MAG: permease-like cell division protein FtsX [Bacteroidota bacterium]
MAAFFERYTRRRLRAATLSTVISLSMVLFLLGLVAMILMYATKLSDYVKETVEVTVIIRDSVPDSEIMLLKSRIDKMPFTKRSVFITKDQAAKEMQQEIGQDFISLLGYNPLLPSIGVYPKAEFSNNDSIAKISKLLQTDEKVYEVRYQPSLIDLVNLNITKISYILLGFSLFLMIIAVALINSTIRLSVYSKRFIIRSMQLVGATQGFIRRPFVWRGIVQGLVGSFLAIAMLTGVFLLGLNRLPELIEKSDYKLFIALFGIVVLLGLLISWVSTFFAVRKYLKIKTNDLYY